MTEGLLLLLKVSVGLLILAIGMGSTFSDLAYLWRRPGLLVRSLLAMYVLVPLAALVQVTLLPLAPGVKAALLVLAVSAGAPLLPKKLGAFESDAYVFSLVVTSSLLAIVLVPAWVSLLSQHFGVATELPPKAVAMAIAKAFLLPLAVGMALRALWPSFASRWSDTLLGTAGIVLMACGVLLLLSHYELLLLTHWLGFVALVALMLTALAIGHLLGGPTTARRWPSPARHGTSALRCSWQRRFRGREPPCSSRCTSSRRQPFRFRTSSGGGRRLPRWAPRGFQGRDRPTLRSVACHYPHQRDLLTHILRRNVT